MPGARHSQSRADRSQMTSLASCTPRHPLADRLVPEEPLYRPMGNEIEAFESAYRQRTPLLLKGPTGCGKTRFVEYMAWRLGKPLITVSCHDDLTAGDLTGRWLLDADGTRWLDGPLTMAARHGAICYLDEMLEARSDTTVVLHPLTDSRRVLSLEKRNEIVRAHPDFYLVASFNPGYQSLHKMLKASTRQRFIALHFDYPDAAAETEVVVLETGIDRDTAAQLVAVGQRTRRMAGHGLDEGASTRMLVYAAALVCSGMPLRAACTLALVHPLSEDHEMTAALQAVLDASFS